METGTIARLTDKGFGFIAREGKDDLFFHANELQGVEYNDLKEGNVVTFEIGEGPKGPNATNVSLAGKAAPAASNDDSDEMDEAA